MTTLSDMTDSGLLLEVARMRYKGAGIMSVTQFGDWRLEVFFPNKETGEGKFIMRLDPNTIHPLWAEYADKYRHLLHVKGTPGAGVAAFESSLTLRGMLEAVWTVLKEDA